MHRRTFIKTAAAGLGSMAIMPACVHKAGPYGFFTQNEAACVIAMTDQVIPADEHGPGAVYANVVNYIDRQLTGVFAANQPVYRKGVAALQQSCQQVHHALFESLDFDTQTAFLQKMEKNDIPTEPWGDDKPSDFFSMVIDHTMQGFYGSPRHGGNKNYISYRLMELNYPLIIGQNRYGSSYGK